MKTESVSIDDLDRSILHALQLDGRVPFARLAQLLGCSEQTVARRYGRMRAAGVVRVIGMIDPAGLGESSWLVRIQSRPDAVLDLGDALARRPDVGWVTVTSGGSELICVARSRTSAERDELLLQRLPKTAQVTSFAAHEVLHRFDHPDAWAPATGRLSATQVGTLLAESIGGRAGSGNTRPDTARGAAPVVTLDARDEVLLAELALDGRAPIARLATITGWTPARTSRRLTELVQAGALYFDAEAAVHLLGFRSMAMIWLTVAPGQLRATGEAVATDDEAVFVAATSGASNLVISVVCRDTAHLFGYVTDGLGQYEAIRQLEVSPALRRLKQGASRMENNRIKV